MVSLSWPECLLDAASNATRTTLFAELGDDVGEVVSIEAFDQLQCRLTVFAIHAHVEGAGVTKTHASSGRVQLHRAHAEIRQDAFDAIDAQRVEMLAQLRERTMTGLEPIAEAIEPLSSKLERSGVAVEADHVAGASCEQSLGVAPSPEGAIDVDTIGARCHRVDDFPFQHRRMGSARPRRRIVRR